MARFITRVVAPAVLALVLAGCESKVNQENFESIKTGMTLGEVKAILGEGEVLDVGGTSISSEGLVSGASKESRKTYVWKAVTGTGEITITFDKDGKVVDKVQRGL